MSSGVLQKPRVPGLLAKCLQVRVGGAFIVTLGVATSCKVAMCLNRESRRLQIPTEMVVL